MFIKLFAKRGKEEETIETTLIERLETYLKTRPEFSLVISTKEDVQFSFGKGNRVLIHISVYGDRAMWHSVHGNGYYTKVQCSAYNPYDVKQIMEYIYDSTIAYFNEDKENARDILDHLTSARRALWHYKY